MNAATAAELAARLDRLPASRALWTIVLLISLGGVFEFYDLFFTAYVSRGMVDSVLLATGGVTAVALFIAGVMLVGIGTISLLGPETKGVALERLNESVAE
jgi:putative MFS transporter